MGVYLPNMEMPKSGAEHTYLMVFPSGTVHEVRYDDNMIVRKGKAVPIPPHGRLIDADVLESNGFHTAVAYTGKMPYEYASMLIADAPTIIEAEDGE